MSEADFSALLSRIVERLEHLSEDRLNRVSVAARSCLQALADISRDSEGLPQLSVPNVGVLALGSQFAVLGNDILHSRQSSLIDAAANHLRVFKQELDTI